MTNAVDGNHHERNRQQAAFAVEILLVVGDGDEQQASRHDADEGLESCPLLGSRITDRHLEIDEQADQQGQNHPAHREGFVNHITHVLTSCG